MAQCILCKTNYSIAGNICAMCQLKDPRIGRDPSIRFIEVTPTGQQDQVAGWVHPSAYEEAARGGKTVIDACRMIFNGTAAGRSAPGTTGVNHIHVGGDGSYNILFTVEDRVVLGFVNGHMDRGSSKTIKNEEARVMSRKGEAPLKVMISSGAMKTG